jgi:hypothetical protein
VHSTLAGAQVIGTAIWKSGCIGQASAKRRPSVGQASASACCG